MAPKTAADRAHLGKVASLGCRKVMYTGKLAAFIQTMFMLHTQRKLKLGARLYVWR